MDLVQCTTFNPHNKILNLFNVIYDFKKSESSDDDGMFYVLNNL